jgi:two-component system nitrogen regulation sensor histidine kinase GlnL
LSLSVSPLQEVKSQQAILELIDSGIMRLDGAGKVLYMNSAAEQCLSQGRERAIGRLLSEIAFIPAEMRDALQQEERSPPQGVRLHDLEFAGGQYDCSIRFDDSGWRLLEFHNLEWEHNRIRLQQRELQTGLLELLSRNLGHEIRNPLGGIRGASQMLANELDSAEMVTLARLIIREVDRIDELIQSFGRPQIDHLDVDFYPLLDEVLSLALLEFGTQTSIERDFDPSIPMIQGDGPAIRQVLLNLIRNAYQAGATTIKVRTRVEHSGVLLQSTASGLLRIDIIDNGEGVPESLRNLLFLPLVTGKRDGTGMGLALSQQIAAAHGGILTYEPVNPETGGGSQFSCYLPLQRSAPDDNGQNQL